MSKLFILSVVLAAAIAAAGCCSLCKGHGKDGAKCKACSTSSKTNCPECGVEKGLCKCMPTGKHLAEVNTAALKILLSSGVPPILVDARSGKYDDGRRIANAISLAPDAKAEDIQSALKSKDTPIVTYCANLKCQASKMLAERLIALGYKNVMKYPQGIEGWVGEGNPVTPGKAK